MSYKHSGLTVLSKADFTDGPVGATLTDTVGGINLVKASNGNAINILGMYKSAPAAPYTLTVRMVPNGDNPEQSARQYGIFLSDGTKYEIAGYWSNNSAAGKQDLCVADYATSTSSPAATPVYGAQTLFGTLWLRVNDDNTNRTWSVSKDGKTFSRMYQTTRTNYLTPTRIGFFANAINAAVNVTFDSWKVT